MLNQSEYISKLKQELSYTKEDFSREDVYRQFEKYFRNKEQLRKSVEIGIFYFDYVKYKTLFQNTLYEDGIQLIVDLCNEAYIKNKEKFSALMKEYYPRIAKGYANQTQLCWLEGNDNNIERNDLAVKKAFRILGESIENSFKPYVFFLNELRALVQDKDSKQKKLGVVVDALINYHDVFRAIYQDMLLHISISQWRNIADHGSYESTEYGVDVMYGTNYEFKKKISMEELELLMCILDTTLYMHKTAYTIVSIDYIDILKDEISYSRSKEDTWNDNLVAQMVETSYSYNFELKRIEKEAGAWIVEIETDKVQEKHWLTQYCSIVATFLGDYNLTIFRNDKVEYVVDCINKKLSIMKFII